MNFKHPATFSSNLSLSPKKTHKQSLWHWLTLILFGLLTIATFPQQLCLLFIFILITALIKGPVMILLSIVYTFLVGLFPPLGILLSILFFLGTIGTLTENWRLSFISSFFYFYPVTIMLLRYFGHLDGSWTLTLSLFIGVILLHLMLTKFYQITGRNRTIFWYIFTTPFTILTVFLPKRLKNKIKRSPMIK